MARCWLWSTVDQSGFWGGWPMADGGWFEAKARE